MICGAYKIDVLKLSVYMQKMIRYPWLPLIRVVAPFILFTKEENEYIGKSHITVKPVREAPPINI